MDMDMDIMMDMDMLGHVMYMYMYMYMTCCYIYVLWFCMGMCYVCAVYAVLLCVGGVAARPKKASSTNAQCFVEHVNVSSES